jgi:hypothetical protein
MLKTPILASLIGLFFVQSCTTEKKHTVPSFVSNKKPDTHYFEQVILKKNSTEVLFYFKFNYKRNEVNIYRPDSEHSDVGIEVRKRFSADSSFLYIELDYFECSDKRYPEIKQKKGKKGLYEPFFFSDDSRTNQGDCAGGGAGFILDKNGEDYELADGFIDDERVESLRYFIFDENQDEQYFFRLNTAEEVVSYPKEQKK